MKHLLFLFSLSLALTATSQPVRFHLGGGFANYTGDIQQRRFTLDQAKGVVSAGATYSFTPKIAIRGDYSFGKVGADDKFGRTSAHRARNLNFQSLIRELMVVGEYTLFDLSDRTFSPYAFAGVGVFKFSPYTYDRTGNKQFLQHLGTEGQGMPQYPDREIYKKTQLNIPFGGGVKYALSDDIQLSAEMGLRKLFTDHLDDVSATYVDENALLAFRGPQAVDMAFRGDEVLHNPTTYPAEGTQRGSAKYKDWYYFGQVRLSIRLNWFGDGMYNSQRSRLGCPTRF